MPPQEPSIAGRLREALQRHARQSGFFLGEAAAQYIAEGAATNIFRTALNDQEREAAVQEAIRALPELERVVSSHTANRNFPDVESIGDLLPLRNDVPYPWNVCS